MFYVRRNHRNPILSPDEMSPWISLATFNPSPTVTPDGKEAIIFRAMSKRTFYHGHAVEVSTIGIAEKRSDGQYGPPRELITPAEDWEKFGCEDPRVTKIDDNYYIFYTALGGFPFNESNIKVAVAVTRDLRTIDHRYLLTPFNAKAMTLFPEKVNGRYTAMLTVHSDAPPSKICLIQFDKLEQIWSQDHWAGWYARFEDSAITLNREEHDHVEVGAPPILTKQGWLLIYSHIQDYFSDKPIFGIEAALLDRDNPKKLISKTNFPFMVPEQAFERYGNLPNIIFPSGATLEGNKLEIYYGACDTYCASASLNLNHLIESMSEDGRITQHVKRYEKNPILKPIENHEWESNYVLNPTAVDFDGTAYIVYRAIGHDNTSVMGLATSRDGLSIDWRGTEPIYIPRADFEAKSAGPGTLSGCEDGRLNLIDDRLYITYTAYNGVDVPQVAISSISIDDFKSKNWQAWTLPQLVTPSGVDDKDAAIFPKRFDGQYMILHRVDRHVCGDITNSLDFSRERLNKCIQIFGPRPGMWDHDKVGIAGPPLWTEHGWLLFYHGISRAHHYQLGAVLLDEHNPTRVIGRTSQPIMTPVEPWEVTGWIPNVVFPCGQIVRDGLIYIYYGGADEVVGVATIEEQKLLDYLL